LTAQGLSTLERRHKRKLVRDKIAAQLILQNYLDYQRVQACRFS
jgi:RNase H-fold protein (predicted Holliday junction resolvase)